MKNLNNNTVALGYKNETAGMFFTVHADKNGIYTPDTVIENFEVQMIYQSYSGYNKNYVIKQDVENPLISLSVFRTDMTAGTTHVSIGRGFSNVFIPVNFTNKLIAHETFAYITTEMPGGDIFVLVKRCGYIDDINDVIALRNKAEMYAFNINEFEEDCQIIPVGRHNIYVKHADKKFEISWNTTQGRRIIACVKELYKHIDVRELGIITIPEKVPCNIAHKLAFIDGKFYKWNYIAGEKVVTSEYQPVEYDGKGVFILSDIKSDADIHCTVFKMSDGKYDDISIAKDKYFSLKNGLNAYAYKVHLEREAKRMMRMSDDSQPVRIPRKIEE